jgi:AcrR family transcriptional regulator
VVGSTGVSAGSGARVPPSNHEQEGTRAYNSPSRRAQSAETRERIVGAAKKLLRKSSVRDWHSLTIRAVAQEAGVNERTVYRHFTDERGLRDAVMRDLERDAGIDLSDLELADVAGVAARIFDHVASYTFEKRPLDPTMTEALLRQREALHDALEPWTTDWPASAAAVVAGLFDVLWSVGSFERLTVDWELPAAQARDALIWLIGLVEEAVRSGRRPPG